MSNRQIRVVCDDNNFTIVMGNGNPMLTSKSYANKHAVKRAAKAFIDQMAGPGSKDIVLEYYDDTAKHYRKLVRESVIVVHRNTRVSLPGVKALAQ